MQDISTKAQALRKIYDQCDDLLDRVESITMVGLTVGRYEERRLDKKVSGPQVPLCVAWTSLTPTELLPLIATVSEKYPLQRCQEKISKAINTVIDQQFVDKNVDQTGRTPKSKKDFQTLSLDERLALLNSEGALEVAEELCAQLQRVQAMEKQSAKGSANRAMAQRRILLRDVSEKAVSSLVEWAYDQRGLHYDNAEHLYDLYLLATRLKFDELAEQSLDRLFTQTSSCIDYTLASGLTLRCLLRFGSSEEEDPMAVDPQANDVVATVFRHVLQDQDPPERLLQLVIDTMATYMDSALWAELKPTVSQNIAHQLVGIMVAYREIKNDQSVHSAKRIKLESHHATDDALTNTGGAHHGSTLAS
ncbi:hypothetical protein N0V94_008365 [Neodidymelliopsis sp. IMI 364377]|nr:hypothetical protein N0V94_008365 [Neodidymelliopsis sp. IMI 364377]